MGDPCSMRGGEGKYIQNFGWGNLKERGLWKDLGVGGN